MKSGQLQWFVFITPLKPRPWVKQSSFYSTFMSQGLLWSFRKNGERRVLTDYKYVVMKITYLVISLYSYENVVMKITSFVIPLYLYECVRCYEDYIHCYTFISIWICCYADYIYYYTFISLWMCPLLWRYSKPRKTSLRTVAITISSNPPP